MIVKNAVIKGGFEDRWNLRDFKNSIQFPYGSPSSVNKKDDKGSNGVDAPFEPLALSKFYIS